ncbi:CPBP family intramembrane metalloprotease [Aliikangiella marina]|uniref:CPBP family intramembrane metalloprotease n=1 Tax=Aliikangiella marina TaxID=1712262 RepID=A0A545THA6_9GAMM|nr:type II CAAX endopeptidase family protein [Aliikangiella marina]TQV76566.1 CPBP family intramembrane metalloprotease [Aliikangiella marina]
MQASTDRVKQIIVFLVVTSILSGVALYFMKQSNSIEYIILYMLCPGLGAITTKLLFKDSLKTFAFGFNKLKYLAVGYLLPLAYILPIYFSVWIFFDNFPNSEYLSQLTSAVPGLTEGSAILLIVGTSATIGVLGTAVTGALGEELGWRGFLVPKLLAFNSFHKTSLLVGVIWAFWHLPIILYTPYFTGDNIYFGIACHSILVISLSYLLTWLYLKSQSIWPVCLFHASHNVFMQQVLSPLTTNTTDSSFITGDFGIGIALLSCLVTFLVIKLSGGAKAEKTFPITQS